MKKKVTGYVFICGLIVLAYYVIKLVKSKLFKSDNGAMLKYLDEKSKEYNQKKIEALTRIADRNKKLKILKAKEIKIDREVKKMSNDQLSNYIRDNC